MPCGLKVKIGKEGERSRSLGKHDMPPGRILGINSKKD